MTVGLTGCNPAAHPFVVTCHALALPCCRPAAGSSTIVSDLLDSGGAAGANGGAPGATSSGQASVGPSSSGTATTPGGNLVMDADGKVYYVNTL